MQCDSEVDEAQGGEKPSRHSCECEVAWEYEGREETKLDSDTCDKMHGKGSKDDVSNYQNQMQPHSDADSRNEVTITCYTDQNKTQYRDKFHKNQKDCRYAMAKHKKHTKS